MIEPLRWQLEAEHGGAEQLSLLVSEVFEADPFSESWFVFCNRRRDKIKILHWQGAGFWLHYRHL